MYALIVTIGTKPKQNTSLNMLNVLHRYSHYEICFEKVGQINIEGNVKYGCQCKQSFKIWNQWENDVIKLSLSDHFLNFFYTAYDG